MDVAALRSKVTFQKNETVTDKYGNHKNAWTAYSSIPFITVSASWSIFIVCAISAAPSCR